MKRSHARPPSPARQSDRHAHFHELVVAYEGYGEEIPLHVPDLSPTGMFLNVPQPFPVGAILKVRFRLSRSNFLVQARAEVRYCLRGAGVGVEFIEISGEAREAIRKELEPVGADALDAELDADRAGPS